MRFVHPKKAGERNFFHPVSRNPWEVIISGPIHTFQCYLSFPPFFQDSSVKLLSNGMLYYEVCGEGLLAWRSEFCVDDFVLGDGGQDGGGAVFSGIKCKTREKFN